MQLTNTTQRYGWVAIIIHWLMAVAIIGMYFLGEFIVDLDYYSPWYRTAPDVHRGIGIILGALLIFRWIWRITNTEPEGEGSLWELKIAKAVHWLFYLLIIAIVISGYLITTAGGQGVSFFGLFDIPATLTGDQQEEIAGDIHEILATAILALAGLHGLAALKHQFFNHDGTLMRMLGRIRRQD